MSIDAPSATSSLQVLRPILQSDSASTTGTPSSANAHTVSEIFLKTVQERGDQIACRIAKSEDVTHGEGVPPERRISVIPWKWSEYGAAATRFAKALIAHGVGPHEVVTIQGSNSPEWLTAHLGAILAGGVSAGVYPTNGKELCEHIVKSSDAQIAVVEDESQLEKYNALRSTALKCIVIWNKVHHSTTPSQVPVLSLDEFVQTGEGVPDSVLEKRIAEQKPEDPCALVYTSGTTGNPKAATLTHRNLTWTATTVAQNFSLNHEHRSISFLPLSHVAPMQLDSILPVITGHPLYIAPPDALKGSNLKDHIVQTKPTYFLAVPRVWEKFKEAMETKLASASFITRHLFTISTTIGRTLSSDYRLLCAKPSLSLFQRIRSAFDRGILNLLEWSLFSKVKAAIGLDHCQFAASGAGAVCADVRDFFEGLNIHILDFYGMSESSGPTTLPNDTTPAGSCGKPIPGTEIQVINADERGEGEIIVRGPNVFRGYWRDPEATYEALDENGFLHTGDVGRLDAEGNLYVTGRLKELIKTSGGENIPPLRIEGQIKAQLPIVSHAVVLGNNRNFLTCLATLKTELDEQGVPTNRLAPDVISALRTIGSGATTLHEAAADSRVREFLLQGIQRTNQLADSHAQFVQKITLLSEEFSIANGTLTPTLKLRRGVIEKKYQQRIAAMYA
jgi:long-chain-fatty-acid--CoA ligase ACSBG